VPIGDVGSLAHLIPLIGLTLAVRSFAT
jgi:hypothetical protein